MAFIVCVLVGLLLLSAVEDFPAWGDPKSPANASNISQHYITKTGQETGVPNLVTAVLADYRGFDTLFETVVVFTAGISIIAILGILPTSETRRQEPDQRGCDQDIIVIQTCRLVIPVIQLFALYVIAHGHHSPGGGFQGGVIYGASLILIAVARDLPTALKRVSARKAVILAAVGVLIYAGFGLACLPVGGNFLDYQALHAYFGTDPVMTRYYSMLGVEIGVAFTVSTIMFAIYAYLSSKGELKGGL
ncbi:MAG: multicomponent Na+:H+ antiporter subunit B [Limisphaerales bacterium]